ncbi:MAG: zf-HC2 domain-containing protein, partial [Acidobacteriota bacterium]
MKTCLQEEILQAYLDGELTQEIGDSVAAHLAACATCAAKVGEAQQTWRAIDGALAGELPEVIPTARLR